ncbi:MAG: PrsW family intramembrane metalloprotease, partial [Alphaproteobacteria bacterium]
MTSETSPPGLLNDPSLDRVLAGSPLRRRAVAVPVVVLLVVLIGLALLFMLATFGSFERDVQGVFLRSLLLSTVMAIVPFLVIRFLDRREQESPWLVSIAFLCGALIATGLALPLNSTILRATAQWVAANPWVKDTLGSEAAMLIGAPIAGPLVEEITKGLGVLALFFLIRAEFDDVRDGFVYGALVGLGFTWLESALYVAQNYAQFGFAPWGLQFGARYALFGLSGHAMFTGIFGAMLGFSRQSHRTWLRWLAPPAGLLIAIAAHATNNVLALLAVAWETSQGK